MRNSNNNNNNKSNKIQLHLYFLRIKRIDPSNWTHFTISMEISVQTDHPFFGSLPPSNSMRSRQCKISRWLFLVIKLRLYIFWSISSREIERNHVRNFRFFIFHNGPGLQALSSASFHFSGCFFIAYFMGLSNGDSEKFTTKTGKTKTKEEATMGRKATNFTCFLLDTG